MPKVPFSKFVWKISMKINNKYNFNFFLILPFHQTTRAATFLQFVNLKFLNRSFIDFFNLNENSL